MDIHMEKQTHTQTDRHKIYIQADTYIYKWTDRHIIHTDT